MSLLEAVVLGIVQGLTEFLPVSSTAHLRIIPALFGWDDPGAPFTAVTQIGTLIAVLVYFRADILRLGAAFLRSLARRDPFGTPDAKQAWWILFATLPIAICGLLFKDLIETGFRSLYVISGSLIFFSILLSIAERVSTRARDAGSIGLLDTQVIGLAQAVALIPGASRSGTTITAGLFLNLTRETAASFSFLLSIPTVALNRFYQLYKLRHTLTTDFGVSLLVAVAVSGIVGFLSIAFLLRYLRSHSTSVFVVYRIALALIILALLQADILAP